jgi:hypothetical protein
LLIGDLLDQRVLEAVNSAGAAHVIVQKFEMNQLLKPVLEVRRAL